MPTELIRKVAKILKEHLTDAELEQLVTATTQHYFSDDLYDVLCDLINPE